HQLLQPFKDVKEGRIKNFADIYFDLKLAQKLYDTIFKPIKPYLKNNKQLIIIPDDVLYYLPFEVLVTQIEKKKFDRKIIFSHYQNGHFLVEQYSMSYAPSATVLEPDLLERRQRPENERLLAFGNPDFGRATEMAIQKNGDQGSDLFSLLFRSSRGLIFSPLPKTEQEIKSIVKIIQPSVYYLEQDAKEETFKQEASKYSIIHLATHCIVDETQPMYSRIVFAQDNDPSEDGFLNTYEVFNLKLNAGLVNLSACETGLGKLSRGEGIIGLTHAFMYAGASSVLVSLWSVSESTADLMKYFYLNLKSGMSKSQSLQQAKLKMIKTAGRFKNGQRLSFANPFLWAPFVLVGEWE
ncbi:MAG: CHAT domain-containing protein, partial [Calditrichaeota bacterium]|nr:CHAT domain-containing protein [Calditrichota bacterium]